MVTRGSFSYYGDTPVCVFNSDGSTLMRSWANTNAAFSKLQNPAALAFVSNKLFVMDGLWVHVFD